MQRGAAPVGTSPFCSPVPSVEKRQIDDTEGGAAVSDKPERDGAEGQPVGEVDRAVDRIERPPLARAISYLCKYLPKDIANTHDELATSLAREAHINRLADEVRWLPCASTCTNWLRFGVQPKGAGPGMVPGYCPHKAHDRANLGIGGRRVLVSRLWTGKTLAGHRADRASVVRAVLEEAGVDPDDHDELAIVGGDGRWSWELLGRSRVDAATYAAAIAQVITTRRRWLREYDVAKQVVAARAGPAPPAA